MNHGALHRVFAMMNLPAPEPNAAGWFHIACPFAPWTHHNGVDRSKGFAVKVEDTGISAYTCPVCGKHGRISGLARALGQYRRLDYTEAADEADKRDMLGAEIKGFEEQFEVVDYMPEPLDESLFEGVFDPVRDHPEAVQFMRRRRVLGDTCDKLKIEYDPDKRRIVFPVRDARGQLFGWSGRTIIPDHKPKVLDYAGLPKRHLILGEDRWREGVPKLIVEGLFGFARMHEIGVEEHMDIGAILGTELTEEKAMILKKHASSVYALVDPDDAGTKCLFGARTDTGYAGGGMIDMLGGEVPILTCPYPQDVGDVDDLTLEQVITHCVPNAVMRFPSHNS